MNKISTIFPLCSVKPLNFYIIGFLGFNDFIKVRLLNKTGLEYVDNIIQKAIEKIDHIFSKYTDLNCAELRDFYGVSKLQFYACIIKKGSVEIGIQERLNNILYNAEFLYNQELIFWNKVFLDLSEPNLKDFMDENEIKKNLKNRIFSTLATETIYGVEDSSETNFLNMPQHKTGYKALCNLIFFLQNAIKIDKDKKYVYQYSVEIGNKGEKTNNKAEINPLIFRAQKLDLFVKKQTEFIEEADTNINFDDEILQSTLKVLPTSITLFQRLKKINLQGNCFNQFFPKDLCNLKNLKEINLSSCEIEFIPEGLFFEHLEDLNLSDNMLKFLPHSFKQCKELKDLDISKNNFSGQSIEEFLFDKEDNLNFLKIKKISFENNPTLKEKETKNLQKKIKIKINENQEKCSKINENQKDPIKINSIKSTEEKEKEKEEMKKLNLSTLDKINFFRNKRKEETKKEERNENK